jgi:hypothetical protein
MDGFNRTAYCCADPYAELSTSVVTVLLEINLEVKYFDLQSV